ncbi:eukaryotic translation initiation factor eIF2A-domain-containing protein [Leucosporidium creatinivorum]|uniref:Eukaryotic translation initiation factor 2A n=1 Tax=Leucosporidium creatinivorum TaxID=106004 RepID=A0A1Y2G0E1_9BASI|nr:eukaryotic translation initiation factor eIF2A-domain-containing protein [Leucosporidium creatinivorum]
MAAPTTQYAYRSLKALGLVSAAPSYAPVASFQKPDGAVKVYRYSPDGRYFASATSTSVVILDADTAAVVSEIQYKGVIDLAFSPQGTQVQTWERHVKPADGEPPHLNLKVWDTVSATQITAFTQKAQDGWQLQYTEDETKAVRVVTNELHVYNPADWSKNVVDKLRSEGVTSCSVSPGRNPAVALFVAEKKGAPASVKIHSLTSLSSMSGSKTFYKADKIQMKWNKSGTNLLFLTQTEVDKTGKSYYGESNLYLMAAAGQFDCRVTLDKEGGIHDFAWSPNDREFSVTYGYMPAKTVIFDVRVHIINDFGTHPRNFLAYNPQGRLLCIAGFGNLAGQVDIWDRKTLKKVCTIDAPNTSHCEWSPDGRYLLCATLSPRLRVDNGMRIFHYTGALMHVESIEELYQASWRPQNAELFPFGGPLEPAPSAGISVAAVAPAKPAAAGGAYRPPHARGTLTPTLFKREDEGGAAYNPANGSNNFPAQGNGRTSPSFQSRGRRTIPGAAPPVEEDATAAATSRRGKKKENQKKNASGASTPLAAPVAVAPAPVAAAAKLEAEAAALSSDDKKRRALMKKLTAIDQLKAKKAAGEKLELTQHKKLDSEAEIRKELAALDVK